MGRLPCHIRYQLEMIVEPGPAAIALRANRKSLPVDRFRADGTKASNSRFLTKLWADHYAKNLVGAVVEMFTSEQWRAHKAAGLAACPTCNVPKGDVCKTKGGKERHPHRTMEAS